MRRAPFQGPPPANLFAEFHLQPPSRTGRSARPNLLAIPTRASRFSPLSSASFPVLILARSIAMLFPQCKCRPLPPWLRLEAARRRPDTPGRRTSPAFGLSFCLASSSQLPHRRHTRLNSFKLRSRHLRSQNGLFHGEKQIGILHLLANF